MIIPRRDLAATLRPQKTANFNFTIMIHFLEPQALHSPTLYLRPNEAGPVENEAVLIVDSGYEQLLHIVVVDVETPLVVDLEYKSFHDAFVVNSCINCCHCCRCC